MDSGYHRANGLALDTKLTEHHILVSNEFPGFPDSKLTLTGG